MKTREEARTVLMSGQSCRDSMIREGMGEAMVNRRRRQPREGEAIAGGVKLQKHFRILMRREANPMVATNTGIKRDLAIVYI